MSRKTLLVIGTALGILSAGCQGGKDPQGSTDKPEDSQGATAAKTGEEGVNLAGGESGLPEDGQIRITLNADGTVVSVEGLTLRSWEPTLTEQSSAPVSTGESLATIEVHALNEDPSDVETPDGDSKHAHKGETSPPLTSHCHRWVKVGGVNYLVHC